MLTASKCASNRGQSGARKSRDTESSRESSLDIIRRGGVTGKEGAGRRGGEVKATLHFYPRASLHRPPLKAPTQPSPTICKRDDLLANSCCSGFGSERPLITVPNKWEEPAPGGHYSTSPPG